jgi:hypothetical protein
MDERDDPVNEVTLLSTRFGNLVPWFAEREPAIKDYIAFADDEFLQSILDKVAEKALDFYINDIVIEWESYDDSYSEWVRSEGYISANGDTDWERYAEDGKSYFTYNTDAEVMYKDLISAVDIKARYLKSMCSDYASDQEETPTIRNINKVISYVVAQEARREDSIIKRLARWVSEEIIINKDGSVLTTLEYKQLHPKK